MAADGHGRPMDGSDAECERAACNERCERRNVTSNAETEMSKSVHIVLDPVFDVESAGVIRF